MTLTVAAAAALQRVDDKHGLLQLLTVTGGGISEPIRLVNDTRDLVSQGQTFMAVLFEVVPPKDAAKEIPRAQLRIDNVGRDLGQELEALPPGAELVARLQVVYRGTPNAVDYEFVAPLSGIKANVFSVTASMGPFSLMTRPAVAIRYDPFSAPGLFPT